MIPIWKNIPFLRLLVPLAAGIICSWYFSLQWTIGIYLLVAAIPFLLFYMFSNEQQKFRYSWLPGVGISFSMLGFAVLLTWLKQLPHQQQWVGHLYKPGDVVQLRLLEPLSEKQKTYKALAEISTIESNQKTIKVNGDIILYFQKDSAMPALHYGNIIALNKPLQEIKNAGNPGGFDYKRYALFNGITHQLFLKKTDYVVLNATKTSFFWSLIYRTKAYILSVLRKHIKGEQEISVAEALLIGYRDDLDRDLVQAYSNTGVVHVIAISGLHLGLIYWLLLLLFQPLNKYKQLKWLKPLLVLSFLWIFSLLTGAGASVLRAAIMFTFISGGDLLNKKGNIYNSMAASAFVLLCYNPFYLWDVGFQLSYAAVLSIVLFMKPIYHWLSFNNKLLDKAWQLNAVTLSAQIVTLPLCMYHFHQAPNLFLITNFVAVPLSSLILFGEILLIAVSFIQPIAAFTGTLFSYLLKWMNGFITWADHFTFAVTDGIQHHPLQTIFLYAFIAALGVWLLQKNTKAFKWSVGFLAAFFLLQSFSLYQTTRQKKLIVYNLSQHTAIDFMLGKQYVLKGDAVLLQDGFLRNFHLKPSRILYHSYHSPLMPGSVQNNSYRINGKKIIHINQSYVFDSLQNRIKADVLIISKNPRLYISDLLKTVDCKLIVFDSSNPQWKINLWKKDCERLQLNYFCTSEQGAFVMNL
ncbi:MAG: ComEC family competence protein [Chitinophagaceae bacterium]|jgi:competence protein ComEC|nr:ComEC family competence protein [Chitinophagaceae bacterium]